MLTTKLEIVWEASSQNQRMDALAWARTLLQNLVHYRQGGRYYPDDVERIAAELLATKTKENE